MSAFKVHTSTDHGDARADLREFGYDPYNTAPTFASYSTVVTPTGVYMAPETADALLSCFLRRQAE